MMIEKPKKIKVNIEVRANVIHSISQWTTEHASEVAYEMMFLDKEQEQKIGCKYGENLLNVSRQMTEANQLLRELTTAIRKEYR